MKKDSIGKRTWIIPDGFLPITAGMDPGTNGYLSHESLCVLNAGSEAAHLELCFYFEDRDPVIIKNVEVASYRSKHVRINQLEMPNGSKFPQGVPYSLVVKSDIPIVVQMSRLDTTQSNMAFLSAMAFPAD